MIKSAKVYYEMMHKKWQYHLLKMLRENVSDPNMEKDIDWAWECRLPLPIPRITTPNRSTPRRK